MTARRNTALCTVFPRPISSPKIAYKGIIIMYIASIRRLNPLVTRVVLEEEANAISLIFPQMSIHTRWNLLKLIISY